MIRNALIAVAVLFGAYYVLSGSGTYTRVVDRPPDAVARGLADLDITEQPGSPGTDPALAGGVRPVISHRLTDDGIEWQVFSGDKLAMTMYAQLTALEDGKKTRITASVKRGDAPEDRVSPLFRSESRTLAIFSLALEDEISDLTKALGGNFEACQELWQRFEASNYASPDLQTQGDLRDRVSDVSKVAIKLHAYEAESKRLGCEAYRQNESHSSMPIMQDNPSDPRDRDYGEPEYVDQDGGWGR